MVRSPMTRRYPGPSLAVDAVWIARGRLLLIRRGRPPFRGAWALPGGFVEIGETVEHAVVRELREETGRSARVDRLIGVYSDPMRDPRKHTVSVVFAMRGRPGRPRGGDDAAEAAWHPLAGLPPLAFDHARIVADARAALGTGPTRAGGITRRPRRRRPARAERRAPTAHRNPVARRAPRRPPG